MAGETMTASEQDMLAHILTLDRKADADRASMDAFADTLGYSAADRSHHDDCPQGWDAFARWCECPSEGMLARA